MTEPRHTTNWLTFNLFPGGNRDTRLAHLFSMDPRPNAGFFLCSLRRHYSLGRDGRRTLERLARLVEPPPDGWDTNRWLLANRAAIHEIIEWKCVFLLAYLAEKEANAELRRVLVWLLGGCRHECSANLVALFRGDPDRMVRREVLRAAQRLNGRWLLERFATRETDVDMQRWAADVHRRRLSYDERLTRYAANVEPAEFEPRDTPLMLADGVELKPHRPKARWLIRLLLERIRNLLGGGTDFSPTPRL